VRASVALSDEHAPLMPDIASRVERRGVYRIEQRGLEKMTTSALHLAARRLIANIYF